MKEKSLVSIAGLAGALAIAAIFSPVFAGGGPGCGEPEGSIYKVEGDVVAPVRLTSVMPVYPEKAREERVEGTVIVRAVIDTEGKVATTEIVEAEREDLGEAAAEAIESWTFEPATLEGKPVSVYYHLTVRFRLDGDDDQEPALR